jgi:hypothetical protein
MKYEIIYDYVDAIYPLCELVPLKPPCPAPRDEPN